MSPRQRPAGALGSDQMVFMVMTSGGRIPSVVSVMQSPSLVVYSDGRILTVAKTPAPHFVPARYDVAEIGTELVRNFVSTVRSEGLVRACTDFGRPRIADAGTTTVMVRGDGGTDEVQVYALDETSEQRLSPPQREARARLRMLIARAHALAAGTPHTSYVPDRVLVAEPIPGRNQQPATALWPGPELSTFLEPTKTGRMIACGELNGIDAHTVYRAALDNPGARWLVDGATRELAVNPLPLPVICP